MTAMIVGSIITIIVILKIMNLVIAIVMEKCAEKYIAVMHSDNEVQPYDCMTV